MGKYMLFKKLKSIISEADEKTPEPAQATPNQNSATGDQPPENNEPIAKQPLKTLADVKNASDGIGKETYNGVAATLIPKLKPMLTNTYNIKNVTSSVGVLTVVFDMSKGEKFIVRSTGMEITEEKIIDNIKMLITSNFGPELKNFDIGEPVYAGGVLNIQIQSNKQKETD